MATEQTYQTDTWTVTIHWGRDVTGNDDDRTLTTVVVETRDLGQEDAVAMATYILEQLEGDA